MPKATYADGSAVLDLDAIFGRPSAPVAAPPRATITPPVVAAVCLGCETHRPDPTPELVAFAAGCGWSGCPFREGGVR